MNQCNFIGRVGQDPEMKYSASGDAIANLSIATNKRWKDKQGVKQEKTTWVKCVAFGKVAELIGQYVQKGSQLRVTTEYDQREYNDASTGEKKYAHQFNIRDMEFLGGGNSQNTNGQQQSSPQYQQPQSNPQQQQPPAYAPNAFDDDDVPF